MDLSLLILSSLLMVCAHADLKESKVWAFLTAGSNGYGNYRHQADICHAYQILHDNGIPDKNIIVMMADDIAYNSENPTPGVIVNKPGGKNVYKGVPKDYTNDTVTPENFLNVLSGKKSAMKGVGSGRVIESGPDDYIFVNFVDHGGPGVLCFGDMGLLAADDLIGVLKEMADKNKFKKMFIYVEACHSGSMFENLLEDDLNIVVMTAADPHENSFACYFDEQRETYLADAFSAMWMHDTEQGILPAESMHHQYQRVRAWTNKSHVEEYGDLDIGLTKLSTFFGFREASNSPIDPNPPPITDLVSNADVPLHILDKKMENTKDASTRHKLKEQKLHVMKMRWIVDKVMGKIESFVYGEERQPEWSYPTGASKSSSSGLGSAGMESGFRSYGTANVDRNSRLHNANFPCYKALIKKFSDRCFEIFKHPYTLRQLTKFIPMCSNEEFNLRALDAISSVCDTKVHYASAIF